MPKILKTSPLSTSKSTELPRVEEEHTEPTVESVHIFHPKLTSKCGLPKRLSTSEEKESPDKLLKEKSQLENPNDRLPI